MSKTKYQQYRALDPFFDIVMKGLEGLVDGEHYWDTVAEDAVFDFMYRFPGFPQRQTRAQYMAAMENYGMNLHSADGLVVTRGLDPSIVVLEYMVHGQPQLTGKTYDNSFCSVVTIRDRKVVGWRDYMDSLAAVTAASHS